MIGEQLAKIERWRDATALEAKRAAFARLQAEAPDAAAFMRDVAEVFGRPSAVRIAFADGTGFSKGQWENER